MITLVMAEFGNRKNCGGANLSKYGRLDPTLTTMLKYFPDLRLHVYSDHDIKVNYKNTMVYHVKPLCAKHPRSLWRSSSYYKALGMLHVFEGIAIAMDSDFYVYSEYIKHIEHLTRKFGLCVPMNPRYTVRTDTLVGADSDKKLDLSGGFGPANNAGFMSFDTTNKEARNFLEKYCERRAIEGRGTVSFWRTMWNMGYKFNPLLLPPQWCVCREHIGIKDPIILHVGHEEVKQHYKV